MFWNKKKAQQQAERNINYIALAESLKDSAVKIEEPWTIAKARLEGNAHDIGSQKAIKLYNSHKARLQNQWVNPLQSVNSGFGNAQASMFYYQPVNYYECYALAQDPMFTKVFKTLSETPFAKGGELADDGLDTEAKNTIEKRAQKFKLWSHVREAVRSEYVTGGCLVFLDFGQSEAELAQPLDLNEVDMRKFKGFRHIDPINCVAVAVNTINPSASDYMKPSLWYVIGLGTVHKSHFLLFSDNLPELPMRPLTLYFGMPLTQLIKQDVANSNLASQGLANLMNRFRNVYLKTEDSNFVTDNVAQFKAKLQFMSYAQDNFSVCPLKSTEDVQQLTTSLTGMAENIELFYLLISAKTDIPYTELMGKSAEGMNATGSGDRRKWYDKCRSIQDSVKDNLLVMYGIIAGVDDGKFVHFDDFVFAPLEEATERELAENIRSYAEVASALIELGAKQEQVFDWLKGFKQFHLDNIDMDFDTEGTEDYDDITPQVLEEFKAQNNGDFKEEDHPRDKDGKFTSGGASSSSGSSEESPKGQEKDDEHSEGLKKSLNDVESMIKDYEEEEGAVFDKDGKIIKALRGNSDAISISDEDLKKFEGAVLTHNHPNNTVFSGDDLFTGFGKANLSEIRVVNPSGTVYSLKKTENANAGKLRADYDTTDKRAIRTWKEKLKRDVAFGVLTPAEADRKMYNDIEWRNDKLLSFFREKAKDYGFIFKEGKLS